MPRTADGVLDHQPFDERSVIVGAKCRHREDLRAAAHQQHLVAADVADELAAVGKLGERDPLA